MDYSKEKRLREQAENIIKHSNERFSKRFEAEDVDVLLQELDIHSAELEAQNDELKQTNKNLEHARREYEVLFSNAPLPIILVNDKMQIQKLNKKAFEYFGSQRMNAHKFSMMSLVNKESMRSFLEWSQPKNMLNSRIPVSLYCRNSAKVFEINATEHPYSKKWYILTLIDKDNEKKLFSANKEAALRNETLQQELLKKEVEKNKNYQQVLYSLLDLVEKRDTYTAGHTQRVARYSVLIAEAMGLPRQEIDTLYEAAIMHDIGKVSTPDAILLKPGKLSYDEYDIIKEHLIYGFEILNSIEAFKVHAQIMKSHHERYDGKGYPCGLKGEDISLLSHILIVADSFDAMTSRRTYKSQKSLQEALDELKELSGIQFSPQVIEVAVPVLKQTGVLPISESHLFGNLEEARLVFYYKDGLTGLYNYHYLEHILYFENHIQKREYNCAYFLNIKNFHHFNKRYGWIEGDNKLIEIAKNLKAMFKEAILFRVYGDDFLILHEDHAEIDTAQITALLNLDVSMLEVEIHHLELFKIQTRDFTDFSNYINNFIHKKTH